MLKAFREGLSAKAKGVIALVLVVIVVGGSIVGYKVWDYKENNPKFCTSCHLMKDAFDKWADSSHKDINCHECHHLSIMEQNQLMVKLVLHNPKEVPARHGKVIVPWKFCTQCHVETSEKHADAPKINSSPFHAVHFFMGQVECTKCHGYKLHVFTPEPRFCVECHPENKEVHGMSELACISCHTDRTKDIKPNREICLSCHGNEAQRARIAQAPCPPSAKQCPPSGEDVEKASKMATFPEDGAMKFECSKCHNPHGKMYPVVEKDCIPCHANVRKMGKHQAHLDMGMKCFDCHRPHLWKVTKAMGKSAKCTSCHGPVDPADFLK